MSESAPDLLDRFYATLPGAEGRALEAAIEAARTGGAVLYLAGGAVRDLLLGRASLDIDVAVEGDVAALAAALRAATGRRVVEHGRFGTATQRGEGFTIDFARTRRETYTLPGALPVVHEAGITDDLARRDFSVNAMALQLSAPAGALLDPFDGRGDLERRSIRVLHDQSFRDDATRMLRAARYAARLGFEIEAGTAALVRRDLGYLDAVSGARLRAELMRAFREESGPEAVLIMEERGVLARIHPRLGTRAGAPHGADTRRVAEAWRQAIAGQHLAPIEELGYCLTCRAQSEDEAASISGRLHLTGRVEHALRDLVRLMGLRDKLEQPGMQPSQVFAMLEPYTPAAIWALSLQEDGEAGIRGLAYLREWRRVRPALDGFDLQRLGVTGPAAGRALRRLRQARLDGETASKNDEETLVRREFGGRG
jgi:tRNA nucleotidyltransferase (CCA-adding enzyme)